MSLYSAHVCNQRRHKGGTIQSPVWRGRRAGVLSHMNYLFQPGSTAR